MTPRVHRLGNHAGLPQLKEKRTRLSPKVSDNYRVKPDFPPNLLTSGSAS
jgi:hypothetical protein